MSDERGYTLIEMVVVMAILGVVISGLTTVFVSGSKAELDLNHRFQAQQQARLALDKLRVDVHCGQAAQSFTVSSVPAIGLKVYAPNCSSVNNNQSTVVWCVEASPTMATTRYALYRTTATTNRCSTSDTSQVLVADDLTTYSNIFTSSVPQYALELVQVDIPVSVNATATKEMYELKDTLVTRNATRCATSGGCSTTASPYAVST